jgi:hypothetical protein
MMARGAADLYGAHQIAHRKSVIWMVGHEIRYRGHAFNAGGALRHVCRAGVGSSRALPVGLGAAKLV